jgi:hypothetical protein
MTRRKGKCRRKCRGVAWSQRDCRGIGGCVGWDDGNRRCGWTLRSARADQEYKGE